MTIRTHIADLKEQRDAYSRLLKALESGRLVSGDGPDNETRVLDLRRKVADLDQMIESEESLMPKGHRGEKRPPTP